MLRILLLVTPVLLLAGEPVPPSPSTAPGIRIWEPPRLTHWPVIQFADETRHVAVRVSVEQRGAKVQLGWVGGALADSVLPLDVDESSGLLALAPETGAPVALIRIGDEGAAAETRLPIILTPASAAWPARRLVGGFPVTDGGTPCVLIDARRDHRDRRWSMLVSAARPRPTGRALMVGDPLAALGSTAWTGLDAECRPTDPGEPPLSAAVVALAQLPTPLPRTILWCPGFSGDPRLASAEDLRLLDTLRSRLDALEVQPRLILALPPLPADPLWLAPARERNRRLVNAAHGAGWHVLDLAAIAGDPDQANLVSDGIYAPAPTGAAGARITAALRDALVP